MFKLYENYQFYSPELLTNTCSVIYLPTFDRLRYFPNSITKLFGGRETRANEFAYIYHLKAAAAAAPPNTDVTSASEGKKISLFKSAHYLHTFSYTKGDHQKSEQYWAGLSV